MSQTGHSAAFAASDVRADGRTNLVGLSREELAAEFDKLSLPKFRVKQVWQWIYTPERTIGGAVCY